ncbi:hypothetical protein [Celerinatantimonas diazotrophica]|uniref:Uncharacterized protein n=1 Tax=Celerinatantimonas diazotrophica TaxID=412034 RepID=A0A4V2PPS5_9GAMM|nr:hypothetical protein [Celerinatantimonas diazotrophica]TCK52081.1 hypothetical protein EV690_2184 [Celerinatantimonas diazotrophica]CAG9296214.1 hypothetical protein CEDIAZO_01361 [Celerinatantimonas diazotrophica]
MKRPATISFISTLLVTAGIYYLIQFALELIQYRDFWDAQFLLSYFLINAVLTPLVYIFTGIGIQNGRQLSRFILLMLVIATYGFTLYRLGTHVFHYGFYFFIPLFIKLFILWQLFFTPAAKYFSAQNEAI